MILSNDSFIGRLLVFLFQPSPCYQGHYTLQRYGNGEKSTSLNFLTSLILKRNEFGRYFPGSKAGLSSLFLLQLFFFKYRNDEFSLWRSLVRELCQTFWHFVQVSMISFRIFSLFIEFTEHGRECQGCQGAHSMIDFCSWTFRILFDVLIN